MEEQRTKRDRVFRAARRVRSELQEFMDAGNYLSLNIHTITNRGTEFTALATRILTYQDVLEDEPDEDKVEADEAFRRDLTQMTDNATTLCNDLVVLKMVSRLLRDLEKDINTLEGHKAAEPDKDYTACYKTADKAVEQIRMNLKDSSIDVDHEVCQQMDLLATRLLSLKTQLRMEAKASTTTTIFKSEKDRDFDTPKVNIPKFKGGLVAWSVFWGRFKASVHENEKLKEAVKMAILLDLMDDPALKAYLEAQSDGKDGRYKETVEYLRGRFDRPRELHQVYCKQLLEIPAIKGTPEELSRTADAIFAAVQGIRGGGQDSIDFLATSLVVSVLPSNLRTQWENKTEDDPLVPHIDRFIEFVRQKAKNASQAQKPTSTSLSQPPKEFKKKYAAKSEGKVYTSHGEVAHSGGEDSRSNSSKQRQPKSTGQGNRSVHCSLCSASHSVFQCKQFLDMSPQQRRDHTQSASLCFNCLREGHAVKDCQSTFRCRLCKKSHNTLLHTDATASTTVNHVIPASEGSSKEAVLPQQEDRLLMTSLVKLTDSSGQKIEARAMLDSGAAISVLSRRMMTQLQLKPSDQWMTVSGVESAKTSPARPTTNLTLTSLCNPGWSTTVKVVILPKAARDLPEHPLPPLDQMPHLKDLTLADPQFQTPRRVDLILDVDVMDQVMLPEKITGPKGTPSAWNTELGWGVMGKCAIHPVQNSHPSVNTVSATGIEDTQLNTTLERFWLLEQPPKGSLNLSPQDLAVEKHYAETHTFLPSAGCYMVTLPKRSTSLQLGESYQIAKHRFLRNEQSLLKKGNWDHFQSVVQEYLNLGHAQPVTPKELCLPVHKTYHLPMHAVFKASSTSTKLRVVFDASCPSSSGVSLNDMLVAGPTLHPNLDIVLLRFRGYRVALTGDVSKMYREVMLSEEDRQLHRFVWRAEPDQPVTTYAMNRVTFGVTSSPYVAVKTLHQIAQDFSTPESQASWHIRNSFYVDDVLAGADNEEEAVKLYKELQGLLQKGGFELKKWRSSSTAVLDSIPTDLQEVLPQQEFLDNHGASYP